MLCDTISQMQAARKTTMTQPNFKPSAEQGDKILPFLEDFQNPFKVFHHTDRVHELKETGDTRPIHLTLGLNNYCNHRCSWCYINWSQAGQADLENPDHGIKRAVVAEPRIIEAVREARNLGLKAVTLVGDGEPTLHPRFPGILAELHDMGLAIGLFSNLARFKPGVPEAITAKCFFVRGSIDAASPEIHRLTHGTDDFNSVLGNLRRLVALRGERSLPILGVQFVASHVNAFQLRFAARLYKEVGVDYMTIKPAYRNVMNPDHPQNNLDPIAARDFMAEAQLESTNTFKVYAKYPQFAEVLNHATNDGRYYKKCHATPLSPYLDEDGNVEMCGNLKGRGFVMGNVFKNSFAEIWASAQRKDCLDRINLCQCPAGCKLDPLNKVLWDAFYPEEIRTHPNFV